MNAIVMARYLYMMKGEKDKTRVQRLLYYAQLVYVECFHKVLFEEEIYRWADGPAIPAVHYAWDYAVAPYSGSDASCFRLTEHVKGHLDIVQNMFDGVKQCFLNELVRTSRGWFHTARNQLIECEKHAFPNLEFEHALCKEARTNPHNPEQVLQNNNNGDTGVSKKRIATNNTIKEQKQPAPGTVLNPPSRMSDTLKKYIDDMDREELGRLEMELSVKRQSKLFSTMTPLDEEEEEDN